MNKLLALFFILSLGQVFATDYICLNVRYKTLNLGEHSFLSIIEDVSDDAYCSGEFGCRRGSSTITTYSLWGSKFSSWRMIKNKKENIFGLGDDIVLNREAINYVRHCKELTYNSESKAYISQMDNFNSDRKKNLHWGYYYGATQFNCTSFSVEFFNKLTGENYSAISPTLRVETPAMLALEMMTKMEKNNNNEDFFQKLIGIESEEERQRNLEIRMIKDRTGPKL